MNIRLVSLNVIVLAILALTGCWAQESVVEHEAAVEPVVAATGEPEFMVYYLHGHRRCRTCLDLQANCDAAVKSGFAEELQEGRLGWLEVNFDETENKHFKQDFKLSFSSLVVAQLNQGQPQRFKNLEQVWQLMRNKEKLTEFIQTEVRQFMQEQP